MSDRGILQDQIDYYRARAGEYDEWWFRTGRYDRGPEFNARWRAEVATVEGALDSWLTTRRPQTLLELACGTGLFTRRLAPRVPHVTAVDASPEVLAINRSRVAAANVDYIEADLFSWRPVARYDAVFCCARSRRRRVSDRLCIRSDVDREGSRAAGTGCERRDPTAQRRARIPHRQVVLGAPSARRTARRTRLVGNASADTELLHPRFGATFVGTNSFARGVARCARRYFEE